jgi:hypothetical protein
VPRLRSSHLRTLERRRNYLDAEKAQGRANSYELAELSALSAVLAEIQERREHGGVDPQESPAPL